MCQWILFLVRALFLATFSLSSHSERENSGLSCSSSKIPDCIIGAPSSWPHLNLIISLNFHLQIQLHGHGGKEKVVRASTHEFCQGHKHLVYNGKLLLQIILGLWINYRKISTRGQERKVSFALVLVQMNTVCKLGIVGTLFPGSFWKIMETFPLGEMPRNHCAGTVCPKLGEPGSDPL